MTGIATAIYENQAGEPSDSERARLSAHVDTQLAGIERDIEHHLRVLPPASHLFVAEDEDATPLGFLHLQTRKDFFTGALNCHISDLVVAAEQEGRGVAAAMLRFADEWAKEHRCRFLTLGVFPNNERARKLYEHHGFGVEILSMVKPVR